MRRRWSRPAAVTEHRGVENIVSSAPTRLPYEPLPFVKRFVTCHIFVDSLILRHLFQAVAFSSQEPLFNEPEYGSEVSNLPMDILHTPGKESIDEAKARRLLLPDCDG